MYVSEQTVRFLLKAIDLFKWMEDTPFPLGREAPGNYRRYAGSVKGCVVQVADDSF